MALPTNRAETESHGIERWVPGVSWAIGCALFVAGGWLAVISHDATSAGVAFAGAIAANVFAFLSKFKKFSGFGLNMEMWEETKIEAEALVAKMRKLAITLAKPTLMAAIRVGRWDSAFDRQERHELIGEVTELLATVDAVPDDIGEALKRFHWFTAREVSLPIRKAIIDIASAEAERVRKKLEGFGRTIKAEDHAQHAKVSEELRIVEEVKRELDAAWTHTPMQNLAERLRAFLETDRLPAAARKDALEALAEDFADLDYYCKNHMHRRLEHYLKGPEA